eukprot:TRINITY_DN29807_c0_g1_i1.p1 TRINITY_DN29807_c0_g1~~TRINITY_DN29807_c0_g1_i1.p1  ORF type:complete len:284 (-),score=49.48 TRINITY_DN29807_c0_g1_i1:143-925(-)
MSPRVWTTCQTLGGPPAVSRPIRRVLWLLLLAIECASLMLQFPARPSTFASCWPGREFQAHKSSSGMRPTSWQAFEHGRRVRVALQVSPDEALVTNSTAAKRNAGRISGSAKHQATLRKLAPAAKSEKSDDSFPVVPAAAALLVGLAVFAASQLGGQQKEEAYPTNSYYVSSSSYVVQSSRGSDGELRTQVKEDNGVWTNIPGLKGPSGSRQAAVQQNRESLLAAQREMQAAQEEVDQAFGEMNREMARAFGSGYLSPGF